MRTNQVLSKKGSLKDLMVISIISVLFLSSVIPAFSNANSVTTTLSSGDKDANITFPHDGGVGSASIDFPYAAHMDEMSFRIDGLPSDESAWLNHSTHDDFNSSDLKDIDLIGDSAQVMKKTFWWDGSWYYRIGMEVNASQRDRRNFTVRMDINLTTYLEGLGINSSVDMNSIRVVEHNGNGSFIKFNDSMTGNDSYIIPYNITLAKDFNIQEAVNFTIEWLVGGNTSNNTSRYFHLYFDTMDRPKAPQLDLLEFRNDIIFTNQVPSVQDSYVFLSNTSGPDNNPNFLLPTIGPYKLDIYDVDRDGYLDILIANSGPSFFNNKVNSYLFYGGPDGYSKTPDVLFPTSGAYGVKAMDVNGDGFVDVVFANNHNGSSYDINSTLFYGSPSGFNSTHDEEFDTYGATDVEIADFNDDDRLDIAFSDYYNGTTYDTFSQVYYGSSNGFASEPDLLLQSHGAFSCTSGDVNGDGIDDLILAALTDQSFTFNQNNTVYYGSGGGLSSTPDLYIKGLGSYSIEVADLNNDEKMDFIVGNSFNGVTGELNSYIYYYNAQGNYQTPDVTLPTKFVYDTAIGDINGDGFKDIAFANHDSSGSSDIDSSIYLGSASGFSTGNNINLSIHGSAGVGIGDLDRYDPARDILPPTITIGNIENIYRYQGILTSVNTTSEDTIHSVVANWSTDVPVGSNVAVEVSNNGGADWKITENTVGTVFDTKGRDLKFRVTMSTNNETPTLDWINITYFMGNFPTNVTLDIGGDGDIEWSEPGTFNYSLELNTSAIMDELSSHTSPDRYFEWEYIKVPMVFTSETSGIIHIYGINITHNSPPYLRNEIGVIEIQEDAVLPVALDLNTYFDDIDNDTLTYQISGNDSVRPMLMNGSTLVLRSKPDWFGWEYINITADDGYGGIINQSLLVVVDSVNDAPVAFIDYDPKNFTSMQEITFSANNSLDIDGVIEHYIWDFGDGAFATGPLVTHAFKGGNTDYLVTLTVIDDGGLNDTDRVTISVGNMKPHASIKVRDDTGNGFDTFVNVLMDMSGSIDKDGTIIRFLLDFGDGEILRLNGEPPSSWEHQYKDGSDTYTITLTVWDDNNASNSSKTTVDIKNVGPKIITVTAPSVVTVNELFKVGVQANDPDGIPTNYMWDFDGDGTFEWTSDQNGNASHKFKKAGTYNSGLKVMDDDGTSSFYKVTIKVEEAKASNDMGLALGVGVILGAIIAFLVFITLRQKSVIMRQKELIVRRDEALKDLQLEQETDMERETVEEIDRIAPPQEGAEPEQGPEEEELENEGFEDVEEEEDLGTLKLLDEDESPEANEIMTDRTGQPTITPSDSTGIMPQKPLTLGDMMGAAQVTPAVAATTPTSTSSPEEDEGSRIATREGPEEEVIVEEGAGEEGVLEEGAGEEGVLEEGAGEEGVLEEGAEEDVVMEEPIEERTIVAKARCPGCKNVIPLYSNERPMRIKCDNCGKEGVIR